VADALEDMIRRAPEQWYTFKPIWPATAEEAAALAARAVSAETASSSPGTADDSLTEPGTQATA
jgi:hypothetical protein